MEALNDNARRRRSNDDTQRCLAQIFNYWLAGTFAPTVVVSNDAVLMHDLIQAVSSSVDETTESVLLSIDASCYRMTRSLYNPRDTPNLRDCSRRW